MMKRILCLLGLLLAGISSVRAQEGAAPLNDVLTFAPQEEGAWLTGEFLFGWSEGVHLGSLVTTSGVGTLQSDAGVLGEPTTRTLLGGDQSSGVLPGFRFGTGYLFDAANGMGIEAGFIYLSNNSSNFSFDSADLASGILARPYNDATSTPIGDPAAVLVGFPGLSTGTVDVESKVGDFYSVNLNITEKIWEEESGWRMDALFGYRFASFIDNLRINQHVESIALPGTSIDSRDRFSAKNTFNGLDFGLRTSYRWSDRLSLDVLTKVAAGNMHQRNEIRGQTVTTVVGGGPPVTEVGGMYALRTNIGEYRRNDWTVMPEGGANLVWKLRANINLKFGYSLIYFTKAARADNQIDFTLDPRLFPPEAAVVVGEDPRNRPVFQGQNTDFWIQAINVGLDVTF